MQSIEIVNVNNYPLDIPGIKKTIKHQVNGRIKVSVFFVDDTEMTKLYIKYMQEVGTTDVLSFPVETVAPNGLILLGDIVVSFPQAKRQAEEFNISVNEEINKLVEHGVLHLLGIHHEE